MLLDSRLVILKKITRLYKVVLWADDILFCPVIQKSSAVLKPFRDCYFAA
ncbi:MAG: hypothetical protein SVV67_07690 [Bacillota bacterium]|nr:hypothetical protein [Bacillota bacterium]